MPAAPTETIVRFIDQRVDDMLTKPRVWASTPESLEFQILGLMEVRGIALGQAATGPDDGTWRRSFTLTAIGEGYVSDRFRQQAVDDPQFVEALRAGLALAREQQTSAKA